MVLPGQPVIHPVPPGLPVVHSVQFVLSPAPTVQPDPALQLNWSHFKPKFAGKSDEDVESHILRTGDWMDTHAFPEGVNMGWYN